MAPRHATSKNMQMRREVFHVAKALHTSLTCLMQCWIFIGPARGPIEETVAGNLTSQEFLEVVLEGIADHNVLALPADWPHERLSEPGSVTRSKTTQTQNEMVVVLQLNQGFYKLLYVAI